MDVKIKKCELNFKNTREKIVMEVTFQKTNEAVDIRDFLCLAMRQNPHLCVEFIKGEYRVTDKTMAASTDACAILEQLPAILQTFRTLNGQAIEKEVPDTNSKPNDVEIQRNDVKGNFEGKETVKECNGVLKLLKKEHFENRDCDSLTDSEIRRETTKETKTGKEVVKRESTSNCANKPQREDIGMKSVAYQGSDNSQAATRSYEDHSKAKVEVTGVRSEETTSSLVSQGVKIKTDESKSNEEGKASRQDPNSSGFEAQQGVGKAEKPGSRLEMVFSGTGNKPDEGTHTSKSGYSRAKGETASMQTDENAGITKARAIRAEAIESDKEAAKCTRGPEPAVTRTEDRELKGKSEKPGDSRAADESVSAVKSRGHAQASMSGSTQQAQNGAAAMVHNEGNTSSLANASDTKMTKYTDTRLGKESEST